MWRKNNSFLMHRVEHGTHTCFTDQGGEPAGGGAVVTPAAGADAPAAGADAPATDDWAWDKFDGDETKVPEPHKPGLAAWKAAQNHARTHYDPMPAVRQIMQRLNDGDRRQPPSQPRAKQGENETDEQFDARVNMRVNELTRQQRVEQYSKKLENFFSKSQDIFGHHQTSFGSDKDVQAFYDEMGRINREGLEPADIYLLLHRERVLNDAYERGKRDGADSVRRAGGSGKPPAAGAQPTGGGAGKPAKVGGDEPRRASKPGDRILEIMKEKNPEAHAAIMARQR